MEALIQFFYLTSLLTLALAGLIAFAGESARRILVSLSSSFSSFFNFVPTATVGVVVFPLYLSKINYSQFLNSSSPRAP
jgi:hypothetical protein